jgi:3-hydroxyacyl-CoA dehydrogenase
MAANKPIRCTAILGTGVIGASWAALFLAHGLELIATETVIRSVAGADRP